MSKRLSLNRSHSIRVRLTDTCAAGCLKRPVQEAGAMARLWVASKRYK